ncbi:FAD/NAD(P)-binding domain-containing protein [Polyplosphaeria fusca]|uniref:FAD/NAD(P)-binding domain-containing protein n=1 Tax=Polyplosphaeria fusca TaxID=682080 RepID=A0A9P4QWZ7_9PLEO|nr:FAD/NAD(P)-binding domain-containing protein [Polyplosphaeria fusca]
MKIVIVGAGITGLATYLHLRKHLPSPLSHSIHIYESHRSLPLQSAETSLHGNLDELSSSTVLVGGGLGISPNGMRVLKDLDPDLYGAVVAQGFRAENFIFKGANGWTLGVQLTSDAKARRRVNSENAAEEGEVCIASSRHGLWECLKRAVEDSGGEIRYRKVVQVKRIDGNSNGQRVKIRSVDEQGSEASEHADLVVGADGVKSVVRTALFGDDEASKPIYTGQSGVGGFIQGPLADSIAQKRGMTFTFGPNGFFGYSPSAPISAKTLMWWSTFETSSLPDTKAIDTAAVKEALVKRHERWRDPLIQDIVQNAEVQSIYPTWVLDSLPNWGQDGMVLIGDAAHALDPTTGQGASQGLEDAQTLALLLANMLSTPTEAIAEQESEAVDVAIKLFYEIRAPRVEEIVKRGKKMSGRKADVGTLAEYMMYCFLWLMMKLPSIGKLILGDVHGDLYCWSAREEIQKALEQSRVTHRD